MGQCLLQLELQPERLVLMPQLSPGFEHLMAVQHHQEGVRQREGRLRREQQRWQQLQKHRQQHLLPGQDVHTLMAARLGYRQPRLVGASAQWSRKPPRAGAAPPPKQGPARASGHDTCDLCCFNKVCYNALQAETGRHK